VDSSSRSRPGIIRSDLRKYPVYPLQKHHDRRDESASTVDRRISAIGTFQRVIADHRMHQPHHRRRLEPGPYRSSAPGNVVTVKKFAVSFTRRVARFPDNAPVSAIGSAA